MLDATALSIAGDLERLLSEDLYPYRYPLTALAVLVGVALLAFAVRRGLHLVLWRYRLASAAVGLPLLIVAVVAGNYLLSPLWERSHLVEMSPLEAMPSYNQPGNMDRDEQPPQMPRVHRFGSFMGADSFHFAR